MQENIYLDALHCSGLGEHGHAWYVNGELTPDLYLAKGTEYTFIVEVGTVQYS